MSEPPQSCPGAVYAVQALMVYRQGHLSNTKLARWHIVLAFSLGIFSWPGLAKRKEALFRL